MNKSNVWNNQPFIRFSLAVEEGANWQKILYELHLYAREQNFRHISPIIELAGEECRVVCDHDPLAALKLEARGIAIANNRLLTFDPVAFSAFVCQLPNKRLMTFGFAHYPEVIQSESGHNHVTPWHNKRVWHGTISTKDSRFIVHPDDCKESHRVAVNLLHHADEYGVIRIVEDMTDYWLTEKESDLRNLHCEIKPASENHCGA